MVQPYTEDEMTSAKFQYNMLLERMLKIIEDDKETSTPPTLKSVIYRICTTPHLYSGIPLAVKVMIYSVGTITSECGIESLISSIGNSNSTGRPISLAQLHRELMVKKNGPHPLERNITEFLQDSLTRHGGGPELWTFSKGSNYLCPAKSVVVSRIQRDAPVSKL